MRRGRVKTPEPLHQFSDEGVVLLHGDRRFLGLHQFCLSGSQIRRKLCRCSELNPRPQGQLVRACRVAALGFFAGHLVFVHESEQLRFRSVASHNVIIIRRHAFKIHHVAKLSLGSREMRAMAIVALIFKQLKYCACGKLRIRENWCGTFCRCTFRLGARREAAEKQCEEETKEQGVLHGIL